jgi:predicted RNase H-like HicB family nuclease
VNYTVILEKESVGGYHASCPALKGCHSEGESEAEALQNIREAMELYIESLAAHNEPIPREEIVIHCVSVAA